MGLDAEMQSEAEMLPADVGAHAGAATPSGTLGLPEEGAHLEPSPEARGPPMALQSAEAPASAALALAAAPASRSEITPSEATTVPGGGCQADGEDEGQVVFQGVPRQKDGSVDPVDLEDALQQANASLGKARRAQLWGRMTRLTQSRSRGIRTRGGW